MWEAINGRVKLKLAAPIGVIDRLSKNTSLQRSNACLLTGLRHVDRMQLHSSMARACARPPGEGQDLAPLLLPAT